jgi:signal transduction histidine kinase
MRRLELNLNLTSVIVMVAAGVMLPVLLATAVGIVALCLARDTGGVITGVLIVSFTLTAAGCGFLALVWASKKASLARQQADFIANISHELRTPLSAIKLYAQTLESGQLADNPSETARCIATILRETSWLDAMIDKVLIWRASGKEMLKLDMKPQSVRAAVEGAVERFRSMVPTDGLTLTLQIESMVPVLHDSKALHTVVLNLLTNAYKYTGDVKQIQIQVRENPTHVFIEVSDNGEGLTQTEAKRVFQPFYRAPSGVENEKGGAGLGLAIARKLIQQHHGSISVSSEHHIGTRLTIRLPVTEPST